KEREAILQRLRKSDKPEDRLAHDPKRLDLVLAETRSRGYGTRDPAFGGGAYGNPPVDDGLAAIAIPLLDRTRVHGSVNILTGSKPHSRSKNSPSGTWPICGQRRPRSSTRFAPARERGSDVDRCKTEPQWSAITDASRPALRAEQTVTILPAGA